MCQEYSNYQTVKNAAGRNTGKYFIFKAILIILLYLPTQVWSYPYTEMYVFGDSLSDTGRLFQA